MARPLRVEFEDATYHVCARAMRESVFFTTSETATSFSNSVLVLRKRPMPSQLGDGSVILVPVAATDADDLVRFGTGLAIGVLPECVFFPADR